ncbi:MAG TPA: hypothetical protein VM431_11070 [Phycisphaerae bacterium]|nr:hypothetical protein [Phycisphaerae bacterium]
MRWFWYGLAAGVCLWVTAAPAAADTIITSSNQTFEGTITEETPQHVVIKTASGTVTIPRVAIAAITKAAAASAPKIVPETLKPADAPKAFAEAKAAVTKGDWIKAGSLLAGLLELPPGSFPHENRVAATAALVTCHLQVKDAKGAAKAFTQRASLLVIEGDKRRLLAAAEALEKADTMMGIVIEGKPVQTYDEAINLAMGWKAKQLLDEAKDMGAKATDLNDPKKLDAVGKRILAKLDEADLYSPGFSVAHRKEAMASVADNILVAAQKAIETCTVQRVTNISRYWKTSAAGAQAATRYNNYATQYLGRRQAAEDGLKNLKAWVDTVGAPELYTERAAAIAPLMLQLDELQYHIMLPGMLQRLRIAPRRIGSQFD